jgi:D-alanyl-D-alanine carboxypeptidase
VSERTGKVVTSGRGYGLGIGRAGTSCAGWGHSGELPGYDVSTVFSENGRRQAVLMVNQDGSTQPKRAFALSGKVIEKAFCAGA